MALSTDYMVSKQNGANYRDWIFNRRLYRENLDLFGHVDGSIKVPAEKVSAQVQQDFKLSAK